MYLITGMEEGIFPSGRSLMDEQRMEEERRLCYVGILGQKNALFTVQGQPAHAL